MSARRNLRLPLSAIIALFLLALLAQSASARSAYVPEYQVDQVFALDSATLQPIGAPTLIGTGTEPYSLAIAPDGKAVWVVNYEIAGLASIDTATNLLIGTAIPIAKFSYGLAITPDGSRAYLAQSNQDTVVTIDLATRQALGAPIAVGESPGAVAITPDGKHAYVSNGDSESVSLIDTATNQVVGLPIQVGGDPYNLVVTPDGKSVFVANQKGYVSVIDTATNAVSASIPLGNDPSGIAMSPDGAHAYVTDYGDGTVSVIDTATRQVVGSPIAVGPRPEYITITPDGKRVLVASSEPGKVTAIDTVTNQVSGFTPVGNELGQIAVVPDQSPAASFVAPKTLRPGVPVTFNAAGSSDPDGTVASFAWQFGDKKAATTAKAKVTHKYLKPGKYKATLTVTDNEGCAVAEVFTGQTASCHGSALAAQTQVVKVAYPGVKVHCPASAKGGCVFKLKAVAKKKGKLKVESKVAKVKVKAGKSAIVSLKPKAAFAKKLAKAKKTLVEVTLSAAGETSTAVKKLKIVQ